MGCTNFMVTKGASKDGSNFITYAADSHTLYGELYYRPAATHPAGKMVDVIEWDSGKKLGKIKQAQVTYSVVGNINEHQLAISETTFGGRKELEDSTGIIDYGTLIYFTLQRAKTAREAIKVMHEMVSEYGYCSGGESISICDGEEVWILEIMGKGVKIYDKKGNLDPKKNAGGVVWVHILCGKTYGNVGVPQADLIALARVLSEGAERAAFFDVTWPEPLPADHPLLQRPNFYVTPHLGGNAGREKEYLSLEAIETFYKYLDHGEIANEVKRPYA